MIVRNNIKFLHVDRIHEKSSDNDVLLRVSERVREREREREKERKRERERNRDKDRKIETHISTDRELPSSEGLSALHGDLALVVKVDDDRCHGVPARIQTHSRDGISYKHTSLELQGEREKIHTR